MQGRCKVLAAALLFLLIAGCATVPITGRQQLSLISQVQLLSLSEQNYDRLLAESRVVKDTQEAAMVERVGERIAAAAEDFMKEEGRYQDIAAYRWEFTLLKDDDNANAFTMPGGKVGVYTGILPITRDENGLATVISHEIAHAIANHGGERMSQLLLIELGGATLAKALDDEPEKTKKMAFLAFGVGANVGVLLPYSRTHELEADYIGLILMARAGYDPRKSVELWQRMRQESGPRPPEFLSTHPAPETRIEYIKRRIPEAMRYYRGS